MRQKTKTLVVRALNLTLSVALVLFAIVYIRDLILQIDTSVYGVVWPFIPVAIIFFIAYYLFMSLNWLLSAKLLEEQIGHRQILVFLASQPYKYLPTSLFVLSSRAMFAKKLGLTIKKSTIAQIFENISILTSNFLLFGLLLLFIYNKPLFLLALTIVTCSFTALYKRGKIYLNFKRRQFMLQSSKIIAMLLCTMFGWLFCGLSFVFINLAFGLDVSLIKFLAGNTIAFSISMLAFFAPGGIGVREVIYKKFGIDSGIIILWRALVFIMDFVIGVPAIVVVHRLSKTSQGTEDA